VGIPRISFSLLLPVVELTLWALLVPTQIGQVWYRSHKAAGRSGGATARIGEAELTLPPDRWVDFILRWGHLTYSHAIVAANLPGIGADLLVSLPTSQPGKWHPSGISLDNWRCLTFPFYCLPAWWFAGCGIDGLLRRRRLRRAMLWTGSVLCLLFAVTLLGYYTSPPRDQADLRWILPGSWLWTVLFGIVPLNWLRRKCAPLAKNGDGG
jgi:hypothetical protein